MHTDCGIVNTKFRCPSMRLLGSTDFALRVLMLLAQDPARQRLSVEMPARRLGDLSRNHLHKIVQELTALGITQTIRGTGGGVVLAVPPDTVRPRRLVRRLEADQPIVECFRQGDVPAHWSRRVVCAAWCEMARECFYDTLDAHTLADCVRASEHPVGAARQKNPA
jgi:Rrf2 family transcriptional regulator, nitric oxide-sensitive transcriptional repressor